MTLAHAIFTSQRAPRKHILESANPVQGALRRGYSGVRAIPKAMLVTDVSCGRCFRNRAMRTMPKLVPANDTVAPSVSGLCLLSY